MFRMRSFWLMVGGLALVASAGCGGEMEEEQGLEQEYTLIDEAQEVNALGSVDEAITNGQKDPGHPAVGNLNDICTATLIGKRTVLSAGHCVQDYTSMYFKVGGATYYSAKVVQHPNYGGGNNNDMGVIILNKDVTGVNPMPIDEIAPKGGDSLTIVGFGITTGTANDYGTKRVTNNTIASVSTQYFTYKGSKNICNGDSGGPSFITRNGQEVLAGIHSTGDYYCGQVGNDMRVDKFVSWIKQTAQGDVTLLGQDSASSSSNGTTTTTPAKTTAGEGEDCSKLSCDAGLLCVGVSNGTGSVIGRYCMEKCTLPSDLTKICESGEKCSKTSSGTGVCFNSSAKSSGFTTR